MQAAVREIPMKRVQNIPLSRSAPQNSPRRPTMAANIPEDLQPPSKKFLATPLELHTNEIKIFLKA